MSKPILKEATPLELPEHGNKTLKTIRDSVDQLERKTKHVEQNMSHIKQVTAYLWVYEEHVHEFLPKQLVAEGCLR